MPIILRRRVDTKENWEAINPVVPDRQLVFTIGAGEFGTPRIKIGDGATNWIDLPYLNRKNNLSAQVDPSATDDSDNDYDVGSLWANILIPGAPKIFICTSSTEGAAVWAEFGEDGGENLPFVESFIAAPSQSEFILSNTPVIAWVWINGASQDSTTWTLGNLKLTLNTPAESGDVVKIQYLTNVSATGASSLDKQIIVNQANVVATLGSPIDPTKEYFLDGIIDITGLGLEIEVPSAGINLKGYDFNISGLTCSDASYTMFKSPASGGSGDVLMVDLFLTTSGVSSKVFDLEGDTGLEALEITRVNFNNCTSLGEVSTYRQGLEDGTGRFGGTPQLTLSGVWLGGYFINTSIVRFINDGAYTLYSAGPGFVMGSRFRSNQNIDLNATVAFIDFAPVNFPVPSTVQLVDCEISRNGVYDSDDSTVIPNLSASDLSSQFRNNNGISNTFVGGTLTSIAEVATVINSVGVYEPLNATWAELDLQHFDSPAPGQLRHLGNSSREYEISINMGIDGGPNDDISIRFSKYKASDSSTTPLLYTTQVRTVNNFTGGRDVAFFFKLTGVTLDQNDYIFVEVANQTDTSNVTLELGGFYRIQER